jgi:VWFA-related protein
MGILPVGLPFLVLGLGFVVAAQSPSSAPTVSVTSQEVLLDFVVQDKKQRPVEDLRVSDVEVFEDGVRQQLKSFRLVGNPREGDAGAASPRTNPNGSSVGLDPRREIQLVWVVVDRLDADARRMAREAMRDVLAAQLPDNIWFAVVVMDRRLHLIQEFTNDKAAISKAVEHATENGYAQYVNAAERVLTKLEENALKEFVLPTNSYGPGGAVVAMNKMANNLLTSNLDDLRTVEENRQLWALTALVNAQNGWSGRKTVIYLSEGLVIYNHPYIFNQLVSAANRNNVTFYALDLRGLESVPLVDPRGLRAVGNTNHSELLSTQGGLDGLASRTGGFAVLNTNDFRAPLKRVIEQVERHYELSYTPTSQNLDGHFRTIQVKFIRPGLTAQTRAGYFAVPVVAGEELKPYQIGLMQALRTQPPRQDLPFRSSVLKFREGLSGTKCVAVFEVPLDKMRATPGNKVGTLRVHGSFLALIRDANGQVVRKLDADIAYQVPSEKAGPLRLGTLTAIRQFDVAPGLYTIEMAALDQEATSIGTKRVVLDVPVQHGVGLSDVVLVRRLDPLEESLNHLDPLQFSGGKVIPSLNGELTGGPGTQATLYFAVYTVPGQAGPVHLDIELTVDDKVLARQSSDVVVSQEPLPYLAQIPFEGYGAGQYLATVTARQGASAVQKRVLITCLPALAR